MAHSNGKITAPVSIADVAAVLGENAADLYALCTSGKINPASRNKPIHGYDFEELTESQRRGTSEDYGNGIFYGVRAASNSTTLGFKTNPHDLDYSYVGKVKKGKDWGRLTDFIGYDHYAKFLPVGDVEKWIYYDTPVPEVQVDFDLTAGVNGGGVAPTGFTGIAVDSLIKILEGELSSLASYYPCACIRVDDNDYVRALEYAPEEQQRPIPGTEDSVVISGTMVNNNAWRKKWYINLTGLDTKAGVIFTDGMKLKVSIIFLPIIKEESLDLTKWTALNAIGAVVNFRAYGCPGAVNKELELRRQYKPGLELKQISGAKNTGIFSAIFSKAESWEAETYYISLSIRDSKTALNVTNNANDSYVTFENSGTRQPEETTPGFETHDPLSRLVVVNLTAPLNGNYQYKWEIFIKKGSQKIVTNGGSGTWTAPTT